MESYLRTKTVTVEGVGELTISELSAGAQINILEHRSIKDDADDADAKADITAHLMALQDAVEQFNGVTDDELKANLSLQQITAVATAVYDHTEADDAAKNSEDDPSDASSID